MRCLSGTLLILITLTGCSGGLSPESAAPPVDAANQIFVTSQPLLEMAEFVSAGSFPVAKIVPDTAASRVWKPSREVAQKLQQARLILINGAGYEPWTARLSLPGSRLIDTASGYYDQLIRIPDAVTHQHGPEGKHGHPGTVWATWLNPDLATAQLSQVTNALVKLSPERKVELEANATKLKSQLESLNQRVSKLQTKTAGMKLTILSDGPFYQYLTTRLGWKLTYMHWSDSEPLSEFDRRDLTSAIEQLPADHRRLFLISSRQSEQAANFASEQGLQVVRIDLCEFPASPASPLQERLAENLTRLENAVGE